MNRLDNDKLNTLQTVETVTDEKRLLKAEALSDALSGIGDDLIRDASDNVPALVSKKKKRFSFLPVVATAAAVLLIALPAGFIMLAMAGLIGGESKAPMSHEEAEYVLDVNKCDLETAEENYNYLLSKDDPTAAKETTSVELPTDFSFSLVFGTYGVSSYDSKTGKLVKTTDATDVSKYTAYVKMSESELKQVYAALCQEIHLQDYPKSYDPFNDPNSNKKTMSSPNQTIIISVTANGETYTVSCFGIPYGSSDDFYCKEAEAFWKAYKKVVGLIVSFPEWEAFPDYEHYYM